MESQNEIVKTTLQQVIKSKQMRKELGRKSLLWFFLIYFNHYITLEIAPFQREIIQIAEDPSTQFAVIVAFRGSAKSTLISLAYVIWSILGQQEKKYPVLLSFNQTRVQQTLSNIRQEFEKNELLISDFGPFHKDGDEWSTSSLVLSPYHARITAVSTGEGIRGLRERQYRPDLIICDDIEDVQSTKTKETRDKLWQVVNGELIPAGDIHTKFVFIGNLVHEDSVMMRLKKMVGEKKESWIYREYPICNEKEMIFWKGKFPTMDHINKLRESQPSEIDFLREYYLKIIPDGNRVILPEWINSYDVFPPDSEFRYYLISVDPAFSTQETADKTAIVVYKVYGYGSKMKMFVLPHPINKRMEAPDTINEIKQIFESLPHSVIKVIIEGVGGQIGIAQTLSAQGIPADVMHIKGQDKRARLSMSGTYIKNGVILFPKTGCEELITQILYFGTERFDDLVDAFTLGIMHVVENSKKDGFFEYMREEMKRMPR